MSVAIEMELSVSRRRIRPLCRETLAVECHGGKGYAGAWLMREEKYSPKIIAMAVARTEGGIIGWCWVTDRGLLGTWVVPQMRRQGIGRRLADMVLTAYPAAWQAARERSGIHYVGGSGNPKAVQAAAAKADGVAFYRALGAEPTSEKGIFSLSPAS
jgi:GNAT superfamily N-acetyltransferase